MGNVSYVGLGPDGTPEDEVTSSNISTKAREGKTPLQVRALKATRRKFFASTTEHKNFKELEAKAAGADPDSRVFAAWLVQCIEVAESMNKQGVRMKLPNLIAYMNNEIKGGAWRTDNRQEVLKKRSAKELQQGMEERMREVMNGK